jgi:predicted HAD superfamily Cof-like phosphohydrolase
MSIDLITLWFERARRFPTDKDLYVQTGVHFEEVAEMMDAMTGADEYTQLLLERAHLAVAKLSLHLKQGGSYHIVDRKDFLDALCDQIVTATGTGQAAGMNVTEGVRRVNASNWTKYDVATGEPYFDDAGKIKKGPNYEPPNLEGCY